MHLSNVLQLSRRLFSSVFPQRNTYFIFQENKMDARNMATVFSPNLVHSEETGARRPESIMYEMEWNNMLVEQLVANVNIVF